MHIIDKKGMYSIEVDVERRIVYERINGYFSKKDMERYHNDYIDNVLLLLEIDKPWAIITDLRYYRASNINEDLYVHVNWKVKHNLNKAAVVSESSFTKFQMRRVGEETIEPSFFNSIEEADNWLRVQGF